MKKMVTLKKIEYLFFQNWNICSAITSPGRLAGGLASKQGMLTGQIIGEWTK